MSVQSVLISRNKYTLKEAKKKIKSMNFRITFKGNNVEMTKDYYIFRQDYPDKYSDYITKDIGNGIKLIIGFENKPFS